MSSMRFSIPDRKRIFEIIEIGAPEDYVSRVYDIINMLSILVNLMVSILYTFERVRFRWGGVLLTVEAITVAFFALDFFLRLFTAQYLYPKKSEKRALWCYLVSFKGLVDVLSFLPYYLPIFFPAGAAAFRLFRVMRFFRLFRINAYYDSFSVIAEVIDNKRQQLMSSVFIILILMVASSLCMYSLEHEAQPEVFVNAFSGIWWSVSTLLTVGYGDIYPITTLGKIFSIVITFLGVGMVAIPTGIISAGFVEQYSRLKRMGETAREEDVQFIRAYLTRQDRWSGMALRDIDLPTGIRLAAIRRGQELIMPHGDLVLMAGDVLILAAEAFTDGARIELKEILLLRHNPWNGQRIRDLDISRRTVIVMVQRKKRILSPDPDLILTEGDRLLLYTQLRLPDADTLEI